MAGSAWDAARASLRLTQAQERARQVQLRARAARPGTPASADLKIVATELKARTKVGYVKVAYVDPRDVIEAVKRRLAARKTERLEQQLAAPESVSESSGE